MPINWNQPLELFDGTPLILSNKHNNPDNQGDYFVVRADGQDFTAKQSTLPTILIVDAVGRHWNGGMDNKQLVRNSRTSITTFKEWAELRGFDYWDGSDPEGPKDWDGLDVMRRDGAFVCATNIDWIHMNDKTDVIGYQTKPTSDPTFTLTLTLEEVTALGLVVNNIGGDPRTTPRKHTDSIGAKLPFSARRVDNGPHEKYWSTLSPNNFVDCREDFKLRANSVRQELARL